MIRNCCLALLFIALFSACKYGSKTTDASLRDFAFEPVKGIRYTEVKRRFSTGLSFNAEGFMQEPSWIIEVVKEDTIMAWSPQKQVMQKFFLQYDHGNVYNFAEQFFKVKSISKDSMVFQRVQVDGMVIASDIRSDVNMTFYANDYIKNTLKTTAAELQKPSKQDTLFIKKRAALVNATKDSAFAATSPVQFIPKSKSVLVEKISTVDPLTKRGIAYDYMFPQYKIEILNAYKDFAYPCRAIVDTAGKINILKVFFVMKGTEESKKEMLQGVAKIYIQNLFKVIPGTTLGIPHNTEITLNVVGRSIKKP